MQPNQRGQHNPLGARGVLQGAWSGLSGGAGQPVQELSFGSLLQSSRSAAPVRYLPRPLICATPELGRAHLTCIARGWSAACWCTVRIWRRWIAVGRGPH